MGSQRTFASMAWSPFLASRTGGIPELVADPDVERVTFPPNASELADTLDRALRDGITVARPVCGELLISVENQ